jgi:hypothetical protein
MLCGESENTNFIVYTLTKPGMELTIYHTRGNHANHYTTEELWLSLDILLWLADGEQYK